MQKIIELPLYIYMTNNIYSTENFEYKYVSGVGQFEYISGIFI